MARGEEGRKSSECQEPHSRGPGSLDGEAELYWLMQEVGMKLTGFGLTAFKWKIMGLYLPHSRSGTYPLVSTQVTVTNGPCFSALHESAYLLSENDYRKINHELLWYS